MSAKKKEKFEWKLCVGCETSFPRSVCIKHEKKYGDNINHHDRDDPESLPDSGFIRNGDLHGICKYINRDNHLLPATKNDLIIVHPSVTKLCKFQITSSVLIKYNGKQTCGTIWPSSSIPVDGVGLRMVKMKTLDVVEGSIITVVMLDVPWIIADKVFLKPATDQARKCFDSILSTMLFDLDGGNILIGDIVSIPYYGDEMFYVVSDIIGDYTNEVHNGRQKNLTDSHKNNGAAVIDNESGICKDSSDVFDVKQLEDKFYSLSVDVNSDFIAPTKGVTRANVFIYNIMIHSTHLVLTDCQKDITIADKHCETKNMLSRMGGLNTQIKLLEELIEFPFTFPPLFHECGIVSPKGIIIHGTSGTGKTDLVHGFVNKLSNVYNATINGPELTSKFHGETEQRLRDVFNKTKGKAPSVLIIDEFDVICPSRTGSSSESEKRVVATLATLLDTITKDDIFVVIAITSKLEQIDLSLRRTGRFDREIEIGVPNATERYDILQKLVDGCRHCLNKEDIMELSEVTHGYVGSDLSSLVKEAGMIAMKGMMINKSQEAATTASSVDNFIQRFSITLCDFRSAMCNVRPSAMKAVMVDIPKVFWRDIGGQHSVKQKMKEAIEWPLKHPDVFKRLGITPPRGLLMYGPPGCSKTLIAKALATESGLNFISIKGPELFNKYLGESERAIREVFRKARLSAPSIVFFDEIDALGVQRSNKDTGNNNVGDRVLAQLLTELDGVESLEGVIIIAATNRPDIIDPALLRPGRIDRLVYVPLPDDDTRREIFEIQFRSIPISEDVDLDTLVAMSAKYSGAEICSLCREAAMIGLRENFTCNEVSLEHFETIFAQIKPAISEESISFYDNFKNKTTGSF